MDPVTLIVSALAAGAGAVGAGAGAGLTAAAKDAVSGLYGQLKAAITGHAEGKDLGASRLLDKHEENPAGYETPVTDLITDSGAVEDPDVVALAGELLQALKDAGVPGSYSVNQTATASGSGSAVFQAGRDQRISGK